MFANMVPDSSSWTAGTLRFDISFDKPTRLYRTLHTHVWLCVHQPQRPVCVHQPRRPVCWILNSTGLTMLPGSPVLEHSFVKCGTYGCFLRDRHPGLHQFVVSKRRRSCTFATIGDNNEDENNEDENNKDKNNKDNKEVIAAANILMLCSRSINVPEAHPL